MPKSTWWFIATAIVFLLQLIPFTGVFLMLFAAPFWSVITVNAGFVSLIVEGLVRPGYRLLLVLPALYFFGYALAAWSSVAQFDARAANVVAANDKPGVVFDPTHDTIVVVSDESSYASGRLARELVTQYGAGRVFERVKSRASTTHMLHGIAAANTCNQIDSSENLRKLGVSITTRVANGSSRQGKMRLALPPGHCSYKMPMDPDAPAFEIKVRAHKKNDWLLGVLRSSEITITTPDGLTLALKSGSAATLQPLPMPVLGCALISSTPSWSCSGGFMKTRIAAFGDSARYDPTSLPVVAKALGLSTSASEWGGYANSLQPASLDAFERRSSENSLALLKTLIEDPSQLIRLDRAMPGLEQRPHEWKHLADDVATAVVKTVRERTSRKVGGLTLQKLLVSLPDEDFRGVGEHLIHALSQLDGNPLQGINAQLKYKIGTLGAVSVPLIERYLYEKRNYPGHYRRVGILALCHAGPVGKIPALRLRSRFAKSYGDTNFAAFITLLRMGEPELAAEIREAGAHHPRHGNDPEVYEHVRLSVTPLSPASVCMGYNDWRAATRQKS